MGGKNCKWVVLKIGVPFRVHFTRVPYYLRGNSNLKNYPNCQFQIPDKRSLACLLGCATRSVRRHLNYITRAIRSNFANERRWRPFKSGDCANEWSSSCHSTPIHSVWFLWVYHWLQTQCKRPDPCLENVFMIQSCFRVQGSFA